MNDGEQRDRAVLITGGGHGIGQGIAAAFAAAGARVVVADRDLQRAADVAAGIRDKFGAAAVPLAVDVRDAAAVEAMANEAAAAIGPIDVLVNNAGIYPNTPVVEMDEAEWDAVFDTNVKGVFLVSRA
ncbi:MAG TPA: SDR family NAD(P)-dependent oxidoreductase, partial [Thermomicrobiales bacterium]|nr:SDR family NAD(P)-dependent oxidoreductase [Thermomicrobiales bacterium]